VLNTANTIIIINSSTGVGVVGSGIGVDGDSNGSSSSNNCNEIVHYLCADSTTYSPGTKPAIIQTRYSNNNNNN